MQRTAVAFLLFVGVLSSCLTEAATRQKRYYAHDAVEDAGGVIAPWYQGQNGLCDLRVRIAAETLRRYPWIDPSRSAASVPEYLFSSFWRIAPEGAIHPRPLDNWMNGDRGQLGSYVLRVLTEYYRYTGDPMAKAHLTLEADLLLDYGQTGPDHSWPNFFISVPTKGKPYGKCDPHGFIQLDIVGRAGYGLLRGYQLTGNARWLAAAKHWGDVLAAKRNRTPGAAPWGRYANPEEVPWGKENKLTGGVVWIAKFLDELIRLGCTGGNNSIVEARDAARAYLRDRLLPAWTVHDTWGHHYWDWLQPTQAMNITPAVAEYLMDYPDYFSNWRNDARNILSLALNRTCVAPGSGGEVYSGAWAYPESCSCCGRCLSAGPWLTAPAWARYAVEADSAWARELARRQIVLNAYDVKETGVAEDNIDGGIVTNGDWFESAHLLPMESTLGAIAWLPELFGPSRENHIVRSTAVVNRVIYAKGRIDYSTFDAPANTIDVLRLAFVPDRITADGVPLHRLPQLPGNGYLLTNLCNGDCLITIRHDGKTRIVVVGPDPQDFTDDRGLAYEGEWTEQQDGSAFGGRLHVARKSGAAMSFSFTGNQVRLLGRADSQGGLADVYLDGVRQPAGIDCWCPTPEHQQVLYYASGLANGPHQFKIVARGAKNPRSRGQDVNVDAIQWSRATGSTAFGEGGGPQETQRMIFGYTGREDYVDSQGNRWKPGCEFVVRSGPGTDSVAAAWWTKPVAESIAGTSDPSLYRYGIHAREFVVNCSVGPGKHHARLKLAATRGIDPKQNCVTVAINGREVVRCADVAATAGGINRAVDLVFNDLQPRNGMIELRFLGGVRRNQGSTGFGEAFVQAMAVGPGDGGQGATPVSVP
jgi:hypothetical protein